MAKNQIFKYSKEKVERKCVFSMTALGKQDRCCDDLTYCANKQRENINQK